MNPSSDLKHTTLASELAAIEIQSDDYATRFVEILLNAAIDLKASDIHLNPRRDGLEVSFRRDGVIQRVGTFSRSSPSDVIQRLKVMAGLLTYRTDVPQEGRVKDRNVEGESQSGWQKVANEKELRVCTLPTIHGERIAVRIFGGSGDFQTIDDLGYDDDLKSELVDSISQTDGLVLISGPAGSGKTTSGYALLREIANRTGGGRSIYSIEDPVEVELEQVVQTQSRQASELDLAQGVRAILRHDPDVIFVGEIRDKETADATIQAGLTGHLVIATLHAGSCVEAIVRLRELIDESVMLPSIRCIVNQRLVRKFCENCRNLLQTCGTKKSENSERSCEFCLNSGYSGRLMVAEHLRVNGNRALIEAIMANSDAAQLAVIAEANGMVGLRTKSNDLLDRNLTSQAELIRVMGSVSE